jgi:hypothetical protein
LDEELGEDRRMLMRGWYSGEKSFRARLQIRLEQAIRGRKKHSLAGDGKRAHEENAAREWIQNACKHLRLTVENLKGLNDNHWQKQQITALFRK